MVVAHSDSEDTALQMFQGPAYKQFEEGTGSNLLSLFVFQKHL